MDTLLRELNLMNNIHNTFHYLNGPEQCIDDIMSVEQLFVSNKATDNNLKIQMMDHVDILNKETRAWLKVKKLSRPRLIVFLKSNSDSKIHLDTRTTVEEWAGAVKQIRLRQVDYRNYLRTCAINWVYDTTGKPKVTGNTNWYKSTVPPNMIITTDAGTGSMLWLNEDDISKNLISVCQHTKPLTLFNAGIPHCIKGSQNRLCI
jgi:hypothetical protein